MAKQRNRKVKLSASRTSKKAAAKKKTARRQSRRAVERVLTSGPLRKRPKDQPLPGLEDARIKPLDDVCASIADTRAQIADLQAEEAGLEQTALNLLRRYDKVTWRGHGVELVRVPGEEKLRVRTSRSAKATAESDPEPEADPIGEVYAADAENEGHGVGHAGPAAGFGV